MAVAAITSTDTNQSDFHVGHFTLDYDDHTQYKLTGTAAGGGTLYTVSDKIDTAGFDSLIFTVLSSSDGGSGAAYAVVAPLMHNEIEVGTQTTGGRLNSITGADTHNISLLNDADLDTVDLPTTTSGSGSDCILALAAGWLDLRLVGRYIVIAGLAGSSASTCKVEFQLHRRRN